jgi:putative restriction endonuclease
MWNTDDLDGRLRAAAFAFLDEHQAAGAQTVRRDEVSEFWFEGRRVPLMDPQRGIRKPHFLHAALSFRTVHAPSPDQRPYDDEPGIDGFPRYKWRGTDGGHPENVALRRSQIEGRPLIWFRGVESGRYLPVYPVWLVGEEPDLRQFVVALDPEQISLWRSGERFDTPLPRGYADRITKARLSQPLFRARVLSAYRGRCAVCNFGHSALLDAAHIRPDADGGEPTVTNGISMCKIHHAAYDADFLGIDPDYRIHIRADLMFESDGPTLRYAFQAMNEQTLHLPNQRSARPDRDLIEARFVRFRAAS